MNGTKTMEQKAAQPTAEKKPLSMWKVILTVIGAIYLLSLVIPAGGIRQERAGSPFLGPIM